MSKYRTYGQHDDNTLAQMATVMAHEDAVAGVLCADGHLGYAHPIGGVAGYREHISISGVGFDIACGNMAVRLDVPWHELADRTDALADEIASSLSFGVGRKNAERVDHALFDSDLWDKAGANDLKTKAREQLGTVGSGNHYVDIFCDEDDWTWIGVHFGSRGLGHTITTRALKAVGAKDGMMVDPALVPIASDIGQQYWHGVQLGGEYAYAGREWVIEKVRSIIGGTILDSIHNHHNFCWQERHGGAELYVVRKGATPAFPGQRGFVGGSMGDDAVILEGIDTPEAKEALYSTVHGAGRIMSRTEARGRFVRDENGKKQRQPGKVRHDEWQSWIKAAGVTLRGGDLDEAPQAYRRLDEVLEQHKGTVKILHRLSPRIVVMAGANEFDPWKD